MVGVGTEVPAQSVEASHVRALAPPVLDHDGEQVDGGRGGGGVGDGFGDALVGAPVGGGDDVDGVLAKCARFCPEGSDRPQRGVHAPRCGVGPGVEELRGDAGCIVRPGRLDVLIPGRVQQRVCGPLEVVDLDKACDGCEVMQALFSCTRPLSAPARP